MPLPIRVSHDSAEPLYHQIAAQLKSLIYSGQLPAGTLLPSIREFARETQCSVITIRRVYQDLESEGLVRTRQGTGTFVCEVDRERLEQFQLESVHETFRQALERVKHAGLTVQRIREVFEQTLQEVYGEEKMR